MNHTPTPWKAERWLIMDMSNRRIAEASIGITGEIDLANAAFIVRACNSHDELIEVLKDAILEIEYLHDKFKTTGSGNATLAKIDAAIAKAEQP
jgi:hypothetical protein